MSDGSQLPRRRVLEFGLRLGAAGAAAVALSGCAIRLERDAPKLPGLRKQDPPKDTPAFQRMTALLDGWSMSLPHTGVGTDLSRMHATQRARFDGVAASNGMQLTNAAATSTPESDGFSIDTLALWSKVSADFRPMFLAVSATNALAAHLLGASPNWTGAILPADLAVAVAPAAYVAAYTLEVVAARTPGAGRGKINSTLSLVHAIRSRIETAAGDKAPTDTSDYTLSADPGEDTGRTRLVVSSLQALVQSVAAQALAPTTPATTRGLVRLWSDASLALQPWESTHAPFPGLTS